MNGWTHGIIIFQVLGLVISDDLADWMTDKSECWPYHKGLGTESDFQMEWKRLLKEYPVEVWKSFKRLEEEITAIYNTGKTNLDKFGRVLTADQKFLIDIVNDVPDIDDKAVVLNDEEDDILSFYDICSTFKESFKHIFYKKILSIQDTILSQVGFLAMHMNKGKRDDEMDSKLTKACKDVRYRTLDALYDMLPMAVLAGEKGNQEESVVPWIKSLQECSEELITQTVIGLAYDAIKLCALGKVFDDVHRYCKKRGDEAETDVQREHAIIDRARKEKKVHKANKVNNVHEINEKVHEAKNGKKVHNVKNEKEVHRSKKEIRVHRSVQKDTGHHHHENQRHSTDHHHVRQVKNNHGISKSSSNFYTDPQTRSSVDNCEYSIFIKGNVLQGMTYATTIMLLFSNATLIVLIGQSLPRKSHSDTDMEQPDTTDSEDDTESEDEIVEE